MKKLTKNFLMWIIGTVGIGLVHGFAHYFFGAPASFKEAAVTPVGITVTVVVGIYLAITIWLIK